LYKKSKKIPQAFPFFFSAFFCPGASSPGLRVPPPGNAPENRPKNANPFHFFRIRKTFFANFCKFLFGKGRANRQQSRTCGKFFVQYRHKFAKALVKKHLDE